MKLTPGSPIQLTATDLSHRSACSHLTELERRYASGLLQRPARNDPALDLLIERGHRHEQAILESFRANNQPPADLASHSGETPESRTAAAMRAGEQLIYQAPLGTGRWHGIADFLIKVDHDRPGNDNNRAAHATSTLGPWSYEVADAKLTRETKAATLLQLLVYSVLIKEIQGVAPAYVHVFKPGPTLEPETFRVADYQAVFNRLQRELEVQIDHPPLPEPYPIPVEHCDVCAWWSRCDKRRRDDDHLSLVAGLQNQHCTELERQGIRAVESFAARANALDERPSRGQRATYEKLHRQAQIQIRGRQSGRPEHEFNDTDPGRGFERLPQPSAGDIFFDLEADRFFDDGGLEYLFGYGQRTAIPLGPGPFEYHHHWATTRTEERVAFQAFLAFAMDRLAEYPDMHIYHFGQYEPAAVKRLAIRYATCETELDTLLRGERFVDLHAVTKESIRASVEQYALKHLEPHYGFERTVALPAARSALNLVCRALELDQLDAITEAVRGTVEGYNREDCESTAQLQDWCESLRAERMTQTGVDIPRPEVREGDASERVAEDEARIAALFEQLTAGIPDDPEERSDEQKALWLLAHCLGYFRREIKGASWEQYRLRNLDPADLIEERKAVTGLSHLRRNPPVGGGRLPMDVYLFPGQEVEIRVGKGISTGDGKAFGTVVSVDLDQREIEIKKRGDTLDLHPETLIQIEPMQGTDVLRDALFAFANDVIENGLNSRGDNGAARDLLTAAAPRLQSREGADPRSSEVDPQSSPQGPSASPLRREGESTLAAAIRLSRDLDDSVLPIQGPPGAGKTYSGARTILDLIGQGKRVGVTAVSHKVIDNLLSEVVKAGQEAGRTIHALHKDSADAEPPAGIECTQDPAGALVAQLGRDVVIGGTAWLWSHADVEGGLDYLFIDEAGQLSLVYALAVSRAARNLVLLGDPQQLQQPQKALHPEGADRSALAHLLGDAATIRPDAGLFLDKTWRLHPEICALTSELYYDGRLHAEAGRENHAILGAPGIPEGGLAMLPVRHEGNPSASVEEVAAVTKLVERLLATGVRFRDNEGHERPMQRKDILIVAPYNAQVALLRNAMPEDDARIGTVDKFQGQSAPVVIYSMAASSVADAPRGMEFLFDPHRFNVATSRAQALCVLVASPKLMEAECKTPRQLKLANGVCRFGELASELTLP